ncbi:S41 family peptidase [Desulfobacter vibrioformis]|uniref:S41 family peptidase n=1 Tax=Desulfobacter vibrioformis TaxID=34031 RepID=UPI0005504BC7|nr:S41 family peptidase [Desulfobacter vibrioformis]
MARHLFVLAAWVLVVIAGPAGVTRAAPPLSWTNDQAMLTFFEAVAKIKKNALAAPDTGDIVTNALMSYMRESDPYGHYLPPHAYRQWKAAQQYSFHGVGMEIMERSGRFYCFPRPESPAAGAGLRDGDELIAVDGESVADHSIYWAGTRIRGRENSPVTLTIGRGRVHREMAVIRTALKDKSVFRADDSGLQVLRISHFSPATLEEIKTALEQINQNRTLVLDLRNNPGGDLFSAVDIAGLFLPENANVLAIETASETTGYKARNRIWKGRPIGLWQNGFTASAAEVLIAALITNHAGLNFGTQSFGKALTQKVVELSDGSALIISRGRLKDPIGRCWQNTGITPVVRIPDQNRYWAQLTQKQLNALNK